MFVYCGAICGTHGRRLTVSTNTFTFAMHTMTNSMCVRVCVCVCCPCAMCGASAEKRKTNTLTPESFKHTTIRSFPMSNNGFETNVSRWCARVCVSRTHVFAMQCTHIQTHTHTQLEFRKNHLLLWKSNPKSDVPPSSYRIDIAHCNAIPNNKFHSV